MYVISILIFFLFICLTMPMGIGYITPFLGYPGYPSLVTVLLLTLPMLFASGLTKDFFRAFRIALDKKLTADAREINRSLTAVWLVMRLLMLSGNAAPPAP